MDEASDRLNADLAEYQRAIELRNAGDEAGFFSLLLRLAERKTKCWQVFNDLARHALQNADTQLAGELLDMAIAREPYPAEATLQKAGLLIQQGKEQDARTLVAYCLEHDATNVHALKMWEQLEQPVDLAVPGLPKLIAYYLPQFHPIPENDRWWGKGFTEWTNVVRAQSLFSGHHQPRLPTDLGFYDLRVPETREEQAQLARRYGIFGFCYYYYWFAEGRRLLERPLEEMLKTGKPDFPFCICWANESWTRRWDGGDELVLMRQDPSEANALAFIRGLVPVVNDSRYIRVAGKPMILVYRVDTIPGMAGIASLWRKTMREDGVGEIYLVAVQTTVEVDPAAIGFDATCEFPPHQLPRTTYHERLCFNQPFTGKTFDYREAVRAKEREPAHPYKRFGGVMTQWDNTPRRKERAHVFLNATPGWYRHWLDDALRRTVEHNAPDERFVFINAWNEWAEGAYLEPDEHNGHDYLRATRAALQSCKGLSGAPLGKYAEITGDTPEDDGLWEARSREYPENLSFGLIVDCRSAARESVELTLSSIAGQSYRRSRTYLVFEEDAPDLGSLAAPLPTEITTWYASRMDEGLWKCAEPWVICLNAGDILTRRCLHVFAESIHQTPSGQRFAAEAAAYAGDDPWESRYRPRVGLSSETGLQGESLSVSANPGPEVLRRQIMDDTSESNVVAIRIPRLAGLRKTTESHRLRTDITRFGLDAIWPTLPWKPLLRVLAYSCAWNDRWFERMADPLQSLRQHQCIELKIVNTLPDPKTVAGFEADVLYVHNPSSPQELDKIARIKESCRLFCVFSLDHSTPELASDVPAERLKALVPLADRLIVADTGFAERLRVVHHDVVAIPEALPDMWSRDPIVSRGPSRKLRIGWFSDLMAVSENKLIAEIMRALTKEADWICLGACTDETRSMLAEQREDVPLEQMPDYLRQADLDLALVPLDTSSRTDDASLVRLLRFGACGYPVIASKMPPLLQELPVVLLDNEASLWVEAIRSLGKNDRERRQMGEALRKAVLERHLLSRMEAQWEAALSPATRTQESESNEPVIEEPPTDAAFVRAKRCLQQGDVEQGLALLIELAESGTADWQVYNELGLYALSTGDAESAAGLLQHALRLNPGSVELSAALQRAITKQAENKA